MELTPDGISRIAKKSRNDCSLYKYYQADETISSYSIARNSQESQELLSVPHVKI